MAPFLSAFHPFIVQVRAYLILVLRPNSSCPECNTRYYNNYQVTSASDPNAIRVYNGDIPEAIEVADHVFVDRPLCEWLEAEMTFSQ